MKCGFPRDDELIKSNFQVMHQKMSMTAMIIINSVIFINNSIIFIVFFFFIVKKKNCQNGTLTFVVLVPLSWTLNK